MAGVPRKRARPAAVLLVVLLLSAAVAVGCYKAPPQAPPLQPPPLPVSEQITRAKELYQSRCAKCHDLEDGIGPRLSRDVLASYASVTSLYDNTRKAMPYDAPASLTQQDYWDLTAYLLFRAGLITSETTLDASSAREIVLSKK